MSQNVTGGTDSGPGRCGNPWSDRRTVARLASFSEAARELGHTRSAVSQHIAALEQDLGAPPLTRRPVAPTAAGERLLEPAAPLLLRLDAARADVVRMAAAPVHGLALATAPTALAPRVLAPDAPLRLPEAAPLTTHGVAEEPVCVLLPDTHPLAGRSALRLGDLAAAGHGLTPLPRSVATGVPGAVAVRLTEPRVVHRTELVYRGAPRGAAARLAGRLVERERQRE
ncbi:LysR family transcriptional regulator [Streptomyces hokutonensis]|uniref:LysR family transcriptional regulator n=1 Tax=Streptomyces hokutonensis TaxID=1306990 RepID=UPI0033EA6049